jgi:hypothetical protein
MLLTAIDKAGDHDPPATVRTELRRRRGTVEQPVIIGGGRGKINPFYTVISRAQRGAVSFP